MPKDCKDCTLCRINHLYVLGHQPKSNKMASPNPKIELAPTDRTLRFTTIALWLPAFPFLLAHGIVTRTLCPVLGIIPMSIAACTGAAHLMGKVHSRGATIFMDLFLAAFFISILIPSWIFLEGNHYYRDSGMTMLGTYATMPLMANFVIHTFFVCREVKLNLNPFAPKTCPHCHGNLSARRHKASMREGSVHSEDSKEAYYHQVGMVEEDHEHEGRDHSSNVLEGRPSTDDETARLV